MSNSRIARVSKPRAIGAGRASRGFRPRSPVPGLVPLRSLDWCSFPIPEGPYYEYSHIDWLSVDNLQVISRTLRSFVPDVRAVRPHTPTCRGWRIPANHPISGTVLSLRAALQTRSRVRAPRIPLLLQLTHRPLEETYPLDTELGLLLSEQLLHRGRRLYLYQLKEIMTQMQIRSRLCADGDHQRTQG